VKIRTSAIWAAFAIAFGVIVLLGYFVESERVQSLRLVIMQWAVILAAAALFIGLVNMVAANWRKLAQQESGWVYSAVLILSFLVTLTLALIFKPDNPVTQFIFNTFLFPIESSLVALLSVTLLVAGFRLLQRRRDTFTLLFLGTALIVLFGTGPWFIASGSVLNQIVGWTRNWLAQVPAAAGARGILLGVALGAVATGLRILLGSDRPYGD
jgi:hypothetical protein